MTIIYIICIIGLLHTYIFYPIILKVLTASKQNNSQIYLSSDDLPSVSILMAAYNEELVIEQKIKSILAADYPSDKLNFYIGSDNSNDRTNAIVEKFAQEYPAIHFKNFKTRQGKPSIINQLVEWTSKKTPIQANHIFIITDANVMFSPQLVFELVKHFKNPDLSLVDSNIINVGMKKAGISETENQYIKGEIQIKHREGILWQQTLGPLGGCFAIRSNFYAPVPSQYLVDDFYIAMSVFEQGGKAINEPKAICYEDVSHDIKEEIRRKTRIGAGNFQNLVRFQKLWLRFPPTSLSFVFVSHKILRWFGFIFIISSWFIAGFLAYFDNLSFQILFLLESIFLFLIPLSYFVTQSLGIHIGVLRVITYFNAANLAMFKGFFKYIKGVKSNVWQPTKRYTTKVKHD